MPKSLDQVNMERSVDENRGEEVNNDDLEIAFRMAVQLLSDGGMQVIKDAINKSEDPGLVVGQFLVQLIGQITENLQQQIDFDPRVFLAQNGWLDLILDYIETELGLPENFSDGVYGEVMELIKAAAQSPDAPNNVMGEESEQGALPQQPQAPEPAGMPAQPQAGGYL